MSPFPGVSLCSIEGSTQTYANEIAGAHPCGPGPQDWSREGDESLAVTSFSKPTPHGLPSPGSSSSCPASPTNFPASVASNRPPHLAKFPTSAGHWSAFVVGQLMVAEYHVLHHVKAHIKGGSLGHAQAKVAVGGEVRRHKGQKPGRAPTQPGIAA